MWGKMEREDGRFCEFPNEKKGDEVEAQRIFTEVLTDVTFFALFCFVAQADLKSVDFTGQVTETTINAFYDYVNRQRKDCK